MQVALARQRLKDEDLFGEADQQLAEALSKQGRTREAMRLLLKVKAAREKLLGPNHPGLVETLGLIGSVHQAAGNHAEGLQQHLTALKTMERIGWADADIAGRQFNVATAYAQTGKSALALKYGVAALETSLQRHGADDARTADVQALLANVYMQRGEPTKALELGRAALKTQQRALGPRHPDVARTQMNLGAALHTVDAADTAALPLLLEALKTQKHVLGKNHPDVARVQHNIGAIHCSQGRWRKGLDSYTAALKIREKTVHACVHTCAHACNVVHACM